MCAAFAVEKHPNLEPFIDLMKVQKEQVVKRKFASQVTEMLTEGSSIRDVTAFVKDSMVKNSLLEHEIAVLLWNSVMEAGGDWNKNVNLIADLAIRHLKAHVKLLASFTTTPKAELALITRVQEYCYDNMNFLKLFQKIIVLFYKGTCLEFESCR